MKRNKKVLVSIALVVVMMMGLVGCDNQSKAVATINGKPLSEASYRGYLFSVKMQMEQGFGPEIWELEMDGESMEGIAKERALDSATLHLVAAEKAKEMKIELTAEEKEEAKMVAKDYVEQFKEPLEEEGITEATVFEMMESILLSQAVVADLAENFTPSEDAQELERFVEENKMQFEMVTAQHVLLTTVDEEGNPMPEEQEEEAKKIAEEVLEKALAGEDMGELAAEYSQDPGSKDNGGEYTFPRGQMVPEFEDVAFGGEAGEVHAELVKTMHGYHIIKTVEIIKATDEEIKMAFEEEQKIKYVNGEMDEWVAGAEVEKTELYDTITLKKPKDKESEADIEETETEIDVEESDK